MIFVAAFSLVTASQATNFYVAPSLTKSGNGTYSNPWDLQTALNHPRKIKPGDTIWLRGGVHRRAFVNSAGEKCPMPTKFVSKLEGTQEAPIIVRAVPGEQPTIDGNLKQESGGYVTFWGLEVMNSLPGRYTKEAGPWPRTWWIMQGGKEVDFCVSGIEIGGNPKEGAPQVPGMKFINCIVHDCIGGGFGLAQTSAGALISGCIVYYNGWRGYNGQSHEPQNHGHGFYIQNSGRARTVVKNCFTFFNYSQGAQFYGTPVGCADYGTYDGLVAWQNSHFQPKQQRNLQYGSANEVPSRRPVIVNCAVYDTRGSGSDSDFGGGGGLVDVIFTNNYFASPVQFNGPITGNISGNSFLAGISGSVSEAANPQNDFKSASPRESSRIFVQADEYEPGRGGIVVFNWSGDDHVKVEIASLGYKPGDAYELHQVNDYFKDIVYGLYDGSPISIPMTGHSVADPVGRNLAGDPASTIKTQAGTFPAFGAFVILKRNGPQARQLSGSGM